jgi:hypothetical protein
VGLDHRNGSAWASPINVDLYDGATLIETVAANLFRADLLAAGIGNGYHAYSYNTPASLKNGLNHTIHAKVSGTTFELWNSPRTLNCPAGPTGYPYYYTDALTSIDTNNWILNGSVVNPSFSNGVCTASLYAWKVVAGSANHALQHHDSVSQLDGGPRGDGAARRFHCLRRQCLHDGCI